MDTYKYERMDITYFHERQWHYSVVELGEVSNISKLGNVKFDVKTEIHFNLKQRAQMIEIDAVD